MRLSVRRVALSGGVIAVLVAGSTVASLPTVASARPAAATFDGGSFDPPVQTLTSSTHKKLRVSFYAAITAAGGGGGGFEQSAGVTVSRKGVPETHNWSFQLARGTFAFKTSTGKGSIKTKSQLSPYAKISLSFQRSGKLRVSTCGKYKTITEPVKVSGSFSFDTRSGTHGWGKVSTKHLSGKTSVIYEVGDSSTCKSPPFTLPCSAGLTWSAFKQSGNSVGEVAFSGSISKVGKKTQRTFYANRNTPLSKPKNAVRGDGTYVPDKNMTFSVDKSGLATMVVKGSGPVTGSATLASSLPGESSSSTCGKPKKTDTFTDWQVSYTNGKSPLAVHEQIEGTYKLPNMGNDVFSNSIDKTVVS